MKKSGKSSYEKVCIDGVEMRVIPPSEIPQIPFVGKHRDMEKLEAICADLPGLPKIRGFRLCGPPGVGKTAMVYELARRTGKDIWVMRGNYDTHPRDFRAIGRFPERSDIVEYVGMALLSAMRNDSIFFLDEIGKVPPGALSPLSAVLDETETLYSEECAIRVKAHPGFIFACALNEGETNLLETESWLNERTRPQINVGYPSAKEIKAIVSSHFRALPKQWIEIFAVCYAGHELSPRTALNLINYAYRLFMQREQGKGAENDAKILKYYQAAAKEILPEVTQDNAPQKEQPDQSKSFSVNYAYNEVGSGNLN